ncbi:hypothetical protein DOD04_12120 [Klebsiella michiganensis]|nr:hypothetical protein DOD04_12120 [Klebsiella michiganensis]
MVFRAAQRDKADLRLRGDIAHSLKSVQLLGWSGQGFYRDRRKVYTPFLVSLAMSVFLFIGMIIQIVNQNKGVIHLLSLQPGEVGLDLV